MRYSETCNHTDYWGIINLDKEIKQCDECGSEFYSDSSKMIGLCPECVHHLYGYPNCNHTMVDGRCTKCYWDGSHSDFIKKLND